MRAFDRGGRRQVSRYGLGHLPDPPGVVGHPIHALIGAPPPLPPSASLEDCVDRVNDQGHTSSCVGQAGSAAVRIRAAKLGFPIPHVSALAAYTLTRGLDMLPGEDLVDAGSMPSRFFESAAAYGVIADERWPFAENTVNDRLPLDVYEAGADARVTGWHPITGSGTDRTDAIKAALANGHPVTFAMQVEQAYEDLPAGEVYEYQGGPSLGGHYQVIVGYDGDAFRVLNSWGTAWCDGGYSLISAAFMGSGEVSDVYAVDSAPTVIE